MSPPASRSTAALIARWTVTAHFLLFLFQVGAVVLFVGGRADAYPLHAGNGWAVAALGTVQLVALLIAGRDRLGLLYLLLAFAMPGLEFAQIGLGRAFAVTGHVSLGLLLWGIALALLIKVWRPDWPLSHG